MIDIKTLIDNYNELKETLALYLSFKYKITPDIEDVNYHNNTLIVNTYYDKQKTFNIDISDLEEWVDNWNGIL